MKIAFLVPTRHRAALAASAIESLLDRQECESEVFVSDNSSDEEERRHLRQFCEERSHPALAYLRPPANLAMGAHWDWVLREVLSRSAATHIALHYDRKISKPGHFGNLARVAARRPDQLITYVADIVSDEPPPHRLWQTTCSRRVYTIRTSRVVRLVATGHVSAMRQAWPYLSNCVVPRTVLETILRRYGSICDAVGPDSRFGFRFCSLHDDYLHYDDSVSVMYAFSRSAGTGFVLGNREGDDFGDFRELWGDQAWLDGAPIPGLNLGHNMSYHEYELTRRESAGIRLPPVDLHGYVQELALSLPHVRDAQTRAHARVLLEQHGWREPVPGPPSPVVERRPGFLHRVVRRLRWYASRPETVRFLAERLRVRPRSIAGIPFDDEDSAVRFAIRHPCQATFPNPDLAILEPVPES